MVAAEKPMTSHLLPTLIRRRGCFDLEQLPTTYTNKWAIFRTQEKEEEEERSHHEKYLTL